MKFGKDLSDRYDSLYTGNQIFAPNSFLQDFIDNTINENANYQFWRNYFIPDTSSTLYSDGRATWSQKEIIRSRVVMPELHVPGSDVVHSDVDGFEVKSGVLPSYARGTYDNAAKLMELAAMAEKYGNDQNVINQFHTSLQDVIDGFDALLSNQAAQVMSTGKITPASGMGAAPFTDTSFYDSDQFKTAGASVWSSTSADLPAIMAKFENDFRSHFNNYVGPLSWKMDDTTIRSTLLVNTKFIQLVNIYLARANNVNGVAVYFASSDPNANIPITIESAVAYSNSIGSVISPIEVIKESQAQQTLITGTVTTRGWDVGKALLSPAGLAGVIKWAIPQDIEQIQKYAAPTLQYSVGSSINGMISIANMITTEGMLRAYHSNVYGTLRPVLSTFRHAWIVDTTTADV